jgi:glutathione synthase/RimK-type ligase-like ATP-grasp enzyme
LSLLILTSDRDLAADYLIVELIDRRLPYFRLNAEDLAYARFEFQRGTHSTRRIAVAERSLDLEDIRSIWYRRTIHPTPAETLPPAERGFVAGELRHLALGLVLDDEARWVNPIDRVSIAEHKVYQLRCAEALGLRIPQTLVSTNPTALKAFAAETRHGAIVKPIFHGLFVERSRRSSIYTRRVTACDFEDESYADCPVLIQEEIPRQADVRATFIGEKCFVADIVTDQQAVDWRRPELALHHSVSTLDAGTESLCRAMLKKLGLVYGAFDFIRSREGELVFLEVNPTGEWAWLEEKLGFKMRDAFIDLFYG